MPLLEANRTPPSIVSDLGTAGVAVDRTPCERCGQPAKVTILEGYEDGQPLRRRLCMACADEADAAGAWRGGRWQGKLSLRIVLIAGGVVLALLGLGADVLGHEGAAGFGGYQLIAVLLGALFVVVGALLRVDLLVLPGTILFALGALADAFGRVGTPGFGWRQKTLIVVGTLLIGLGALCRRRKAAADAEPDGPPMR